MLSMLLKVSSLIKIHSLDPEVRIGCTKPSVVIASSLVLGLFKSERREDKRMQDKVFGLLSKTIHATPVSF